MKLHLILVALALQACSPPQNWRQVDFEGSTLRAQLPCKPDRTVREVPLGGVPVGLSVAGCESGDALLVIMTAALKPGSDAQAVLEGWRRASLGHLQLANPEQRPWVRVGMLPLSAAVQVKGQAKNAQGQAIEAEAVWGAWLEAGHVRVVHAAIYAPRVDSALAQTLFEGLQP